jgi:hypothetical protein
VAEFYCRYGHLIVCGWWYVGVGQEEDRPGPGLWGGCSSVSCVGLRALLSTEGGTELKLSFCVCSCVCMSCTGGMVDVGDGV